MGTVTLYARVEEVNYQWLKRMSMESGIPLARIVDALLAHARVNGMHVAEQPRLVVERS